MQDNQATATPTGFSWYTGNGQPNNTSGGPSTIPIQQANSEGSDSRYQIPVNHVQGPNPTHVELAGTGQPITINANEVIINNNVPQTGAPSTSASSSQPQHTEVKTTEKKASNGTDKVVTEKKTTDDQNPLGIPSANNAPHTTSTEKSTTVNAAHPPSNTEHATSTTSTDKKTTTDANPLGIPPVNNAPNTTTPAVLPGGAIPPVNNTSNTTTPAVLPGGAIPPANGAHVTGAPAHSTAPGATTTNKDGIHDTPLSTGTASDKAVAPPLSTQSTSSTLPANSNHPAAPTDPKAAKKEKKSIKAKLHDFKEKHLHKGGGAGPNGDVHPKDSRDGKTLPSEEELSHYIGGMQSGEGPDHNAGLPKDKLDTTGKTVTGSDANPSKASNPFHAPTPSMAQAPIDAKAQ